MNRTYEIPSNAIIHELLDWEVIVAHLETGAYYSLRGSAVPIWQLLIAGHSVASIRKIVREKMALDAAAEIDSFTEKLVSEGLLRPAPSLAYSMPDLLWPEKWDSPAFEKYEEMKNLLMLDPVHEVDEQGWPSKF